MVNQHCSGARCWRTAQVAAFERPRRCRPRPCAQLRRQPELAALGAPHRSPRAVCQRGGAASSHWAAALATSALVASLWRRRGPGRQKAAVAGCDSAPGDPAALGPRQPIEFHVAPMVNVTSRHFRQLMRLITPRAILWTEMVRVDSKLLSCQEHRCQQLDYHPAQHPVVLQLAGSEPERLAEAVRLVAPWGYDEINLNCGCPSGEDLGPAAFGAALMRDPDRTAAIAGAMREAAGADRGLPVPVSIKCRLAARMLPDSLQQAGAEAEYGALRTFVERVARGCAASTCTRGLPSLGRLTAGTARRHL